MSCNINEYMDELKEKYDEISSINMEITKMTDEYEKQMGKLTERLICQSKNIQALKNTIVSVKLEDLIDELSWLSGISIDKIMVSMKFNMMFSNLDELFEFTDGVSNREIKNIRLRLCSDSEELYNKFDYFMFLSIDTNDCREFIERCTVSLEPYSCSDEVLAIFSVVKNIDDVICNFNLGRIEHSDNISWYPSDLFSQAVFNCVQRDYNCRVDKIREKVKK